MKEITNKMIICNLHRFLQYLAIGVFLQSKKIYFFDFAADLVTAAFFSSTFFGSGFLTSGFFFDSTIS
jgi:hypothetical protein